ncbi:MAG: cupin domain-containing protein [Chloroflexota bacterium]
MQLWNSKIFAGLVIGSMVTLNACTTTTESSSVNTSQTNPNSIQATTDGDSTSTNPTEAIGVIVDDLEWRANPDISGVESAVVVGDSSQSELYVLFGKLEQDTEFPAHTHPDARITTVLSGTMYYGIGEQFEESELTAYPVGSVVYTPHFMWARDGATLTQEAGYGSTGVTFMSEE